MNNRFINKKSKCLVSSLLLALSSGGYAADSYEVIEIKNLQITNENPNPESNPTFVFDINNSDVAVGYFDLPAFYYDANEDGIDDINELEATYSHGYKFSFSDGQTIFQDAGSIDNTEDVLVEITNEDDEGEMVTETVTFDGQYVTSSYGFSINDSNLIAGFSNHHIGMVEITTETDEDGNVSTTQTANSSVIEQAVILTQDVSSPIILPNFLSDEQQMRALSINDSGFIVGYGDFNPENDLDDDGNESDKYFDRGFIYNPSNADEVIRVNPIDNNFGYMASIRDINNSAIAVGWAQKEVNDIDLTGTFYIDALSSSEITEISIFNEEEISFPWAINDSGRIVGKSADPTGEFFTAFAYDIYDGLAVDLGMLISSEQCDTSDNFLEDCSVAFDINDPVEQSSQGDFQVVGTSLVSTFPATYHAFIYENGEMKDLNDLIDCKIDGSENQSNEPDWILAEARAINDSGVIVGNGLLNGVQKAFMLRPRETAPVLCETETNKSGGGSLPIELFSFFAILGWLSRKTNS